MNVTGNSRKNICRWLGALALPAILAIWTGLKFPPQYDEPAHQAFSEYISHHPLLHTIVTYEGSQNNEAKAPLLFLIASVYGKVAGFSLPSLRLLSVPFALAAVWALGLIARRFRPATNLDFTLLTACVPYFLILSLTFMTDVPCLALMLCTMYCYLSYLDQPGTPYLALGILAATLTAYLRIDFLYILAAIGLSAWQHKLLTKKLVLGLLLPLLLRLPLVFVWGGLAAPPAQGRPNAVALGLSPAHLVFALGVIGFYFWPLTIRAVRFKVRPSWPLTVGLVFAIIAALVWTPRIIDTNVDQYGGTLRSLWLKAHFGSGLQKGLWAVLATIGVWVLAVAAGTEWKTDPQRYAIQLSCLIGVAMQIFRGPVMYERYLLEVSPFVFLLLGLRGGHPVELASWGIWGCGLQFTQLFKAGVLP